MSILKYVRMTGTKLHFIAQTLDYFQIACKRNKKSGDEHKNHQKWQILE